MVGVHEVGWWVARWWPSGGVGVVGGVGGGGGGGGPGGSGSLMCLI